QGRAMKKPPALRMTRRMERGPRKRRRGPGGCRVRGVMERGGGRLVHGTAKSPDPDSNRGPLPYHGSALPTELSGRGPHCSEGFRGDQGCMERRWPFMRAAESEQRKAMASARSSTGVKAGLEVPLSSRMRPVSMALMTMMFD